jgi:single-strand DNA-binding protein
MARGVNKVILLGNLGNDPDVKYTQGGMAIATLSVATTFSRKDKDGNFQEKTEWHRVKLFGKTAEVAGEYLKKGRQVYIEGRIEYGSYEKDGVKHYTTDIIGEDMQMLGGGDGQRGGGEGGGFQPRASGGGGYGSGGDRQQRAPAQRRDPAPAKPATFDDAPFDDDIPF